MRLKAEQKKTRRLQFLYKDTHTDTVHSQTRQCSPICYVSSTWLYLRCLKIVRDSMDAWNSRHSKGTQDRNKRSISANGGSRGIPNASSFNGASTCRRLQRYLTVVHGAAFLKILSVSIHTVYTRFPRPSPIYGRCYQRRGRGVWPLSMKVAWAQWNTSNSAVVVYKIWVCAWIVENAVTKFAMLVLYTVWFSATDRIKQRITGED